MDLKGLSFIFGIVLLSGCSQATLNQLAQLTTTTTTQNNSLSTERSVLTSSASLVTASQEFEVRFRAVDEMGNPYTQTRLEVGFEAIGGGSTFLFGKVEGAENGEYFSKVRGIKAGTASGIQVKVNGILLNGQILPVEVKAGPADVEKSAVISGPIQLRAGESDFLRLRLSDSYGNPVQELVDPLTFQPTGGTSRLSLGTPSASAGGEFQIPVTGEIAGSPSRVKISIQNRPGFVLTSQDFTVKAGVPALQFSNIQLGATILTAGSTTDVSLTLKDRYQNRVTGESIVLGLAGGLSQGTFGPLVEVEAGVYEGVLRAETAGAPSRVRLGASGIVLDFLQPQVEVIERPSLIQSTVEVSETQLASGRIARLRMIAKDSLGRTIPAAGLYVMFSFSGGGSTGSISSTRDLGDGVYEADLTGIRAGSASSVSAFVDGVEITSAKPNIQVVPGALVRMSIERAVDGTLPLGNPEVLRDAQALSVFLNGRDASGNFVSTMSAVNWSVTKPNLAWVEPGPKGGAILRAHTTGTASGDPLGLEAEVTSNGVLFRVQSGPIEIVHTPQQVPGLVAWYKADALETTLADGAAVGDAKAGSVWEDWSGSASPYAANEPSQNRRPTYVSRKANRPPMVLFCSVSGCADSTSDRLRIATSLSNFALAESDFTIFTVSERGSDGANHILSNNSVKGGPFLGWMGKGVLRLGTNGSSGDQYIEAYTPPFFKPQLEMITGRLDQSGKSGEPGLSLFLDGALISENPKFDQPSKGGGPIPYLGGSTSHLSLGEVLIYSRALSKDERCEVQTYLNLKWSLQLGSPCR
ncbi:MAG: hypothetical protein K2X47_06695 [Bdellovibrionales bacterium]|nr:hypothetical protein [Bdellovibrionales bacterium]